MFRKTISILALFPFAVLATAQNPSLIFPPRLDQELFFAHFGNGPGLVSELLLVSSDTEAETQAQISLLDQQGNLMAVELNGQMVNGFLEVRIPPAGTRRVWTSGSGALALGSIRILSDRPLAGTILFGGDFGLAGVGDSLALDFGFRTPVDADADSGIRTGMAVTNLESQAVDLEIRLYDPEGLQVDSAPAALVASGHMSLFVEELEWQGATDLSRFEGTVEVLSSGRIAATALQVRPGQYASLPVAPLSRDPRQPAGQSICPGRWSGTYDNAHSSAITFEVVDQSRIESIRVHYRNCNGQSAQATAASGTIQADRSFSIPLSGPDLVGNVAGIFSQDGKSVSMQPGSGVFVLLQCGGGDFSWRAQPDTPCR